MRTIGTFIFNIGVLSLGAAGVGLAYYAIQQREQQHTELIHTISVTNRVAVNS